MKIKLLIAVLFVFLLNSCIPSQKAIENMLEETKMAEPTSTPINYEKPKSSPSSTSFNVTLGEWYGTWSIPRTITIKVSGDTYKMTEVYSDGSRQTITLGVEVVGGETRLFDTINAYGDYMVVKSDGSLAFYDNQGFIYDIDPSSSKSSSSPSSSSSTSTSSECDEWWDALELAYIISGGEDTEVTNYIMGEMVKEGCPAR